jgi:hypothetical protein
VRPCLKNFAAYGATEIICGLLPGNSLDRYLFHGKDLPTSHHTFYYLWNILALKKGNSPIYGTEITTFAANFLAQTQKFTAPTRWAPGACKGGARPAVAVVAGGVGVQRLRGTVTFGV